MNDVHWILRQESRRKALEWWRSLTDQEKEKISPKWRSLTDLDIELLYNLYH